MSFDLHKTEDRITLKLAPQAVTLTPEDKGFNLSLVAGDDTVKRVGRDSCEILEKLR